MCHKKYVYRELVAVRISQKFLLLSPFNGNTFVFIEQTSIGGLQLKLLIFQVVYISSCSHFKWFSFQYQLIEHWRCRENLKFSQVLKQIVLFNVIILNMKTTRVGRRLRI